MKKNIKIANIQFVLACFVVIIHSRTLFVNLPNNINTNTIFGNNISSFIQVFIGDGITRIAVPLFLIISSYLFYKNFDGTFEKYNEKLRSRFHSLAIPYLFWSIFTFLFFSIGLILPFLSKYFATVNTENINLKFLIDNIIIGSYNSPLWFVRYLIVFTIFSPQIYLLAKRFPKIVIIITFLIWIFGINIGIAIRTEAVFFYLLGAVLGCNVKYYHNMINYLNNKKVLWTFIFCSVWIIILLLRTFHYIHQEPSMMLEGNYDKFVNNTNNFGILFGIIGFWLLFDFIFKNKYIWKLSEYSFFVFVFHHPLTSILRKLFLKSVPYTQIFSIITFILIAVLSIIISIFMATMLKKYTDNFYKIITGNRK